MREMKNDSRPLTRISPVNFTPCRVLLPVFFLLLISACTPARSPGRAFEYYTLEYPSPAFGNRPPLSELLTVERFSTVQAFKSTAMVYRSAPSVLNAYTYHRWKSPPPEMVTDLVLRDLRQSGLFKAVFSDYDEADARFVLQGRLEEFLEIEERGNRKAMLSINITLMDRSRREHAGGIIFQKGYRALEPLEAQTPADLARAMSRAMEKASRQMTSDIYGAVEKLGKSKDAKPAS
jgi:cholesterol transport system auxiliary component